MRGESGRTELCFTGGMFVLTLSCSDASTRGLDVFTLGFGAANESVFVCFFLCMCVQFQGGVWSLNMLMCDSLMTMDVMLCTASIFNLCAISVDRYVCVKFYIKI